MRPAPTAPLAVDSRLNELCVLTRAINRKSGADGAEGAAWPTTGQAGPRSKFPKRPGPPRGRHTAETFGGRQTGSGRIRFETRRAFRRGVATGPSARGVR